MKAFGSPFKDEMEKVEGLNSCMISSEISGAGIDFLLPRNSVINIVLIIIETELF